MDYVNYKESTKMDVMVGEPYHHREIGWKLLEKGKE